MERDYFNYMKDSYKPSSMKNIVRGFVWNNLALACGLDGTVADNWVEDT